MPFYFQTWQTGARNDRLGEKKYFTVDLQQRPLLLNLTRNTHFLLEDKLAVYSVLQHLHDDAEKTRVVSNSTVTSDCHYTGLVHERNEEGPVVGWAAVSLCNGMVCAYIHLFLFNNLVAFQFFPLFKMLAKSAWFIY